MLATNIAIATIKIALMPKSPFIELNEKNIKIKTGKQALVSFCVKKISDRIISQRVAVSMFLFRKEVISVKIALK